MGMRKKMKLFIAMVSVGALLGTIPVMAAEQPELPTKVQDIANGSDELYGEGVPIEHGTNPDERFSSGGVDHTHQYIGKRLNFRYDRKNPRLLSSSRSTLTIHI